MRTDVGPGPLWVWAPVPLGHFWNHDNFDVLFAKAIYSAVTRRYDQSSKETLVPENTQAGMCNCWSCTLPNCCKTSLGIRMPSMAFQFVEAAGKISWGRSTPCSANHSWQYSIHWSLSYVRYSVIGRQHSSDCRLLVTSPTVCTICCLRSVTLTWLAVYGRLHLIRYSVPKPIDSKTHFFLIAWLIISDINISDICVICYCMLACLCVCYSLFLSSLWLPYTINDIFVLCIISLNTEYKVPVVSTLY